MRRYAIPLKDASHWTTSPERKRVIKTHFNWELLPYSEEARYIAVDPGPEGHLRVQLPLHQRLRLRARHALGRHVVQPVSLGRFLLGGSWAVNTAGYWAERHRPNVLIVSFKSMKRDLRATVLEVAEFLDIQVSDAVIDEVCRRSSFEYMKRIDHKFRIGKIIAWRPAGAMIRKGAQGGSSELLSLGGSGKLDAYFMSELKRLGSDFPYEEFCDVAR